MKHGAVCDTLIKLGLGFDTLFRLIGTQANDETCIECDA